MISLRGNHSFLLAFRVLRWRYPARTHHLVSQEGGVHVRFAVQGDDVGDHAGEKIRLALSHLVAEKGIELA